jgi:uncharacterized Zn finger protein (UPF0148 family)
MRPKTWNCWICRKPFPLTGERPGQTACPACEAAAREAEEALREAEAAIEAGERRYRKALLGDDGETAR